MAPFATEQVVHDAESRVAEVRQKLRDLNEKRQGFKTIEYQNVTQNVSLSGEVQDDIDRTLNDIKVNSELEKKLQGTLGDVKLSYSVGVTLREDFQNDGIKVEEDEGVSGTKRGVPEGFSQPLYKRYRTGGGRPDEGLEQMLDAMTDSDMRRLFGDLLRSGALVHKRDFDLDGQGKPYAVEAGRAEYQKLESWVRPAVKAGPKKTALEMLVRRLTDQDMAVWTHVPKPLLDLMQHGPNPNQTHATLDLLIMGVHRTRLSSNTIVQCLVGIANDTTSPSMIRDLAGALEETYDQTQRKGILKLAGDGSIPAILRGLADEDQNLRRAMVTRLMHASLMLAKGVCLGTALTVLIGRKLGRVGKNGHHEGVQEHSILNALHHHDIVYRLFAARQEEKAAGHELDQALLSRATYNTNYVDNMLKHEAIIHALNDLGKFDVKVANLEHVLTSPNRPYVV
ncbi:hypothetical protein PG991_015862 [Apiospora marii]|uniref:Uncharacterized protein n=1 Tax=Apiospora marii TaxID=335849 RepID=A0ABR1R0J3_9PEZI